MKMQMRADRTPETTMRMLKQLIYIKGAIEIYFESECESLKMIKDLIKFKPEYTEDDERYNIHDEILELSHQISERSTASHAEKQGEADTCTACCFNNYKE